MHVVVVPPDVNVIVAAPLSVLVFVSSPLNVWSEWLVEEMERVLPGPALKGTVPVFWHHKRTGWRKPPRIRIAD